MARLVVVQLYTAQARGGVTSHAAAGGQARKAGEGERQGERERAVRRRRASESSVSLRDWYEERTLSNGRPQGLTARPTAHPRLRVALSMEGSHEQEMHGGACAALIDCMRSAACGVAACHRQARQSAGRTRDEGRWEEGGGRRSTGLVSGDGGSRDVADELGVVTEGARRRALHG